MTTFTDEVRQTVSPYKFGGSRRAAALYLISLGGCIESSGSVESPTGWFAIDGRTILYEDDRGFVDCETFPTVADARAWFTKLEDRYSAWLGDEDDV